jgi:hypothetical protein
LCCAFFLTVFHSLLRTNEQANFQQRKLLYSVTVVWLVYCANTIWTLYKKGLIVLECFALYKPRKAPCLAPIFHIRCFLAANFGPGGLVILNYTVKLEATNFFETWLNTRIHVIIRGLNPENCILILLRYFTIFLSVWN